MNPPISPTNRPFHVMTKPAGPACNLDCTYCFYTSKVELYPGRKQWAMPEDVLETYVRQYIEAQDAEEIQFAWQGGEPTLRGLDFFKKAVEFQEKYANGKRISNAFQTNGVLIDEDWARFFADAGFLVGLSIDGPPKHHNRYRVDHGGRGSAQRVLRALELFKRHNVEFNTLTCVHAGNVDKPLEIYRFLKNAGSRFLQFIPIIESASEDWVTGEDGYTHPVPPPGRKVTPWSVDAKAYGKFLTDIFDYWVRHDVGREFVQLFDVTLQSWAGYPGGLCVYAPTCGEGLALEHNGDLYACDHYVYPEFLRGNITETPVGELARSEAQRSFGEAKRDALPTYCRKCPYLFACNGGCPKERFMTTPDGEPGLNYLCPAYKQFFGHVAPFMDVMAREVKNGRPAANVMRHPVTAVAGRAVNAFPNPNDACPCGSGRKYKKCCGGKGALQ